MATEPTPAVKEVREFKQSPDAAAGVTGFIFRGEFYATEAELPTDEESVKLRQPKGRGLQRSAGALAFAGVADPGALQGRSGSGKPQTADIIDTLGRVVASTGPTAKASTEDLEKLSKAELEELATARGVVVTRSDGEEGAPRKQDFVDALSG